MQQQQQRPAPQQQQQQQWQQEDQELEGGVPKWRLAFRAGFQGLQELAQGQLPPGADSWSQAAELAFRLCPLGSEVRLRLPGWHWLAGRPACWLAGWLSGLAEGPALVWSVLGLVTGLGWMPCLQGWLPPALPSRSLKRQKHGEPVRCSCSSLQGKPASHTARASTVGVCRPTRLLQAHAADAQQQWQAYCRQRAEAQLRYEWQAQLDTRNYVVSSA